MWEPIETAPKDNTHKLNYILIKHGCCIPDIVIWRNSRPERLIGGNRQLSIPEGWFCVSGSRSRIYNPTHWHELP